MSILKSLVAVAFAFLLAGCVTVPPPNLAVGELQQLKLTGVVVEGIGVVRSWPGEEDVFLKTNAVDQATYNRIQTEPATNYEPLRAHLQHALDKRFGLELESQVGPILSGVRPVVAVVRLKVFDVPSVVRRVFVDSAAKIKAEIDLVEAKSGALILRYDGPYQSRPLVGGIYTGIAVAMERSDVGHSLITDYVTAYRNWLLQR